MSVDPIRVSRAQWDDLRDELHGAPIELAPDEIDLITRVFLGERPAPDTPPDPDDLLDETDTVIAWAGGIEVNVDVAGEDNLALLVPWVEDHLLPWLRDMTQEDQ